MEVARIVGFDVIPETRVVGDSGDLGRIGLGDERGRLHGGVDLEECYDLDGVTNTQKFGGFRVHLRG